MFITNAIGVFTFLRNHYKIVLVLFAIAFVCLFAFSVYKSLNKSKVEYAELVSSERVLRVEKQILEDDIQKKNEVIKNQENLLKQKDESIKNLRYKINSLNTQIIEQKKSIDNLKTAKEFEDKLKEIYKCATGC